MKHFAPLLILILYAAPLAAAWDIDATNARWFTEIATADATEARDAILWDRERRPLVGAIFTAALPNLDLSVTSGGNSEMSITMARGAFDTWAALYVANACPSAVTNQERLDCIDSDIKSAFRSLVIRYRTHLRDEASPVDTDIPDY
jgi:hypothetical protein